MLRNYFKIAIKNLLNNKLYSFITIFGLAFGMACFLLIFSYIRFENSYNDFHKNAKNIYRLDKQVQGPGYTYYRSLVGSAPAIFLHQEYAAVKNTVRLAWFPNCLTNVGENASREKSFLFADSSVFNVFTFPLKIGDAQSALEKPFSVVITPQIAQKYFGNENPVGKIIYYQLQGFPGKFSFTVTGVCENIPSNSTIKFDFLASFSSYGKIIGNEKLLGSWDGPIWTFVQLPDNYDPKNLEALFPTFAEKFVPKTDIKVNTYRLVSLKDTYYEKGDGIGIMDFGIRPISYFLLVVAFLVLLIACLNYMNLLSAHSIVRAKEIGVRKVQGASRVQLIIQFIGESVIVSFFSLLLAILLVELLLPSFKTILMNAFPTMGLLAKRNIDFNILDIHQLVNMIIISFTVGILAGIYPAIVLSGYNPTHILKGELRAGKTAAFFRKILVVIQFSIAVIFITCSLHILLQINHWKNADLGFNKNDLITVPVLDNSVKQKYQLLKNELLQSSNITSVTSSNLLPGGDDINVLLLRSGTVKDLLVGTYYVDEDFIKTVGLKMNGGRDFSVTVSNDSKSAILMNQAAIKACGWNHANGQEVELYTKENDKTNIAYTANVIGEIKDFQYRSFLDQSTLPLIIKVRPDVMNYILVRTNKGVSQKAIADIKSVWKDMNFDQSFECSYLTDEINENYSIFESADSLIRFGAIITIIIASLGLFALASFIIDRKTKEIGIRKVMGASTRNIIFKLSGSFIMLVLIANAIGLAISYQLVSLMLQELPHHIEINVWLLSGSFVFLMILAIAAVGVKSFEAATVDPVKSLKYE